MCFLFTEDFVWQNFWSFKQVFQRIHFLKKRNFVFSTIAGVILDTSPELRNIHTSNKLKYHKKY